MPTSSSLNEDVKQHYTRPDLGTVILTALASAGKDLDALSPDSCGKEKWRIFSVDWRPPTVTPLAGRTERRYANADVATEDGRGQAG